MRKTALWIVIIGIGIVFGVVALIFEHSYFETRIDAQKEEMQKEREILLLKLEEILSPPVPEILYATLTFEQVQQAKIEGRVACIGAYPLAGIEFSGDVMQFVIEVGGAYQLILLEKGKDVYPSFIQIGAPYTICKDMENGQKVVWVHPSG